MSTLPTNTFTSWSATHFAALALILILAALALFAFRTKTSEPVRNAGRWVLALVVLLLAVIEPGRRLASAEGRWQDAVPLHLCDVSLMVTGLALATRKQVLFEFAYYFGTGGTLQALLTPDLALDFPSHDYLAFFAGHGVILIGVAYLLGACGMQPRRGAIVRMLLAGNLYLVIAGIYNVLAGTNYGYLRSKPPHPSLLDLLGPWPWYLIWIEAIGIVTIVVLSLPFARTLFGRDQQQGSRETNSACDGKK